MNGNNSIFGTRNWLLYFLNLSVSNQLKLDKYLPEINQASREMLSSFAQFEPPAQLGGAILAFYPIA